MKKKIVLLFSMLFLCVSVLFGCTTIKFSDGPSAGDTVYGNGGSAVVKGNYLYFANAYIDYNDLEVNQNDYDPDASSSSVQKLFGIYRVKLNESGVVDVDEDGVPSGAEIVVPEVGGYAKSGLYICGDYLYYTTPYSAVESGKSESTKGLLRFERVKLNGTDHLVLSKGEYNAECTYYLNYVDGVVYITILDGENISVIKCKNGVKTSYSIASGVSSMAVYEQSTIVPNKTLSSVNKYVYYTKTQNSSYTMYRKPLSNEGSEEAVLTSFSDELSLVKVKNDRVYYTKNKLLYSSSFANAESPKLYSSSPISDGMITDYVILDDTNGFSQDRGVAFVFNNTNYLLAKCVENGEIISGITEQTQISIMFSVGDEVFYQLADDDALYAFDFATSEKRTVLSKFVKSAAGDDSSTTLTYDFDGDRVFFFSTVEGTNGYYKYLHVALLEFPYYKDSDNNPIANYIGIMDSSDELSSDK